MEASSIEASSIEAPPPAHPASSPPRYKRAAIRTRRRAGAVMAWVFLVADLVRATPAHQGAYQNMGDCPQTQ